MYPTTWFVRFMNVSVVGKKGTSLSLLLDFKWNNISCQPDNGLQVNDPGVIM